MSATDPAQDALELVGRDPGAALAAADAIVVGLPRPRTAEDARQVATAHRAAGLALRSLGDPATGEKRMRRGISVAEKAALDDVAAEVRMSTAFVLLDLSRPRAALASVDQALAVLRGARAARARVIRALVLQRAGRMREAMQEYAAALPVLRRARDRDWEARLRHNRALLSIELGETRAAIADLEWTRAYDLAAGHTTDAADALFNIGVALEAAGDIPGALATFDRAEQEWVGVERPERWAARVDAYLRVGLVDEARVTARAAVDWLSRRQWPALEANARLSLAQCLLAGPSPEPTEASDHALRARALFGAEGRHEGRDRADYLVLRSALALGASSRELDRVPEICSRLLASGGDAEASDLRAAAGETALARGDLRRARSLLGPLAATTRASSPEIRSRAALARALLAEAHGDVATARRELTAAWTEVERQRSLLGATELRAASGAHADVVVARGSRLAVESGSVTTVFGWAERSRAAALRYQPTAPPRDPDLARALARLRTSTLTESESLLDGEWSPSLERERSRREREVVRLSRRTAGSGASRGAVTVADVRRALDGDETFVHVLAADHRLRGVVVARDGARIVDLGDLEHAVTDRDSLVFSLRRLVTAFAGARHQPALVASLASAAERLEERMVRPLVGERSGPLVLCLPSSLTSLPWTALPGLIDRPVTIAPSARAWVVARRAGPDTGHGTVAVAGPGLPGARAEAIAVAAVGAGSTVVADDAATVARVLSLLPAARALHVAAHGHLRQDNPLFSSLQLADGPLTGFDLDAAPRVPSTVVLSACSAGRLQSRGSEEPIGFAWTLLALGARRVVAPLLPVPDELTTAVMVDLHRDLESGIAPARALADARRRAVDRGDLPSARVAACFAAYGA